MQDIERYSEINDLIADFIDNLNQHLPYLRGERDKWYDKANPIIPILCDDYDDYIRTLLWKNYLQKWEKIRGKLRDYKKKILV